MFVVFALNVYCIIPWKENRTHRLTRVMNHLKANFSVKARAQLFKASLA